MFFLTLQKQVLFVNTSPMSDVKLIDFGLSRVYAGDRKLTDVSGTIYTMAPEVIKGRHTEKADMWSIGTYDANSFVPRTHVVVLHTNSNRFAETYVRCCCVYASGLGASFLRKTETGRYQQDPHKQVFFQKQTVEKGVT